MKNDRETTGIGSASGRNDDPIALDMAALRAVTARDLPPLETTALRLTARADSREGFVMTAVETIARRPWWATAAVATAIAVALLFIPFSYEQTVGQDVSVTIAGNESSPIDPGALRPIADAFRTATGTGAIRLAAGETTTLSARLAGRSHSEATAIARAFTHELEAKGLTASFAVTPWREKVSGNVYAQASARWRQIRVETQGRSESDIEKDVTAQLQQMGFRDTQVTFHRSAGENKFEMEAKNGDEHVVAHIERKGGHGTEQPVEVGLPNFSDLKGKSDAEIKAEIERELKARGIDATVIVKGGEVQVKAEKKVEQH
jgi:hypothetical protein